MSFVSDPYSLLGNCCVLYPIIDTISRNCIVTESFSLFAVATSTHIILGSYYCNIKDQSTKDEGNGRTLLTGIF